jgi:transposase
MGIVEVVGGVDTHADFHVGAVVDANGGLLAVERFRADDDGYLRLLAWLAGFGRVVRVGVEGTGSYGVGLVRFLTGANVGVIEVDR